jgi:tripartite-type tricarboxylate transporter receptor subunit TctC
MFSNIPPALPYIASGKLRPLAVTGSARSGALPDVPTVAESGVRDYQVVSWIGLFAPAGTPSAVVSRLHAEVARALASPAGRQRFASAGADAGTGSPQDFGAFLAAERVKWSTLIREADIKAE